MSKWPHIAYGKKTTILLLQFAKNGMSISSKLRPQEEVKDVSSKRNTLYFSYQYNSLHTEDISKKAFTPSKGNFIKGNLRVKYKSQSKYYCQLEEVSNFTIGI